MYVSQYFTKDDKATAEELVTYILDEYKTTIENSTWMDKDTRASAFEDANKTTRYIGYHDTLISDQSQNFYDDIPTIPEENYLDMGMAQAVFNADHDYKRFVLKEDKNAWTK